MTDYRAIFACRRKVVGLDDDGTWRDFLEGVTGKRSLKEMDGRELGKVLDRLHQSGAPRVGGGGPGRARAQSPVARKARSLWLSLWQLGEVDDPSEKALAAFGRRQLGVDDLRWADQSQADPLIEALKNWCRRAGYAPETNAAIGALPEDLRKAPDAAIRGFNSRLITAQWERLADLGAFQYGASARLDTWLLRMGFKVAHQHFLDPARQRQVIDELGRWIRRVKAGPKSDTGKICSTEAPG